jgi:hypothetical protein
VGVVDAGGKVEIPKITINLDLGDLEEHLTTVYERVLTTTFLILSPSILKYSVLRNSGPAIRWHFITNKSFIPFFEELLDVKDADCFTIRPTPLKISRSTNVIIEWAAKSEVITQQIFQRLPVF